MSLPKMCPRCGHATAKGYGLAGGGFGAYVYCTREGCDFFQKEQENPSTTGPH